jgi:beta-glucanase (GH16 family)
VVSAVLVGTLLTSCGPAKSPKAKAPEPEVSATPKADTNPLPTRAKPGRPCGPKITRANGRSWRCTFADNFDGTSLDGDKWLELASYWSGLGGPDDCYFDDGHNVRVANGRLRLITRRLPEPRDCAQAQGGKASYTGAMLNTLHRFSQERGRFEFRARFPQTRQAGQTRPGIQGSLWMWPVDDRKYGPWPSSGEIDIAEFYSAFPDRIIPFLHYDMETRKDPLAAFAKPPQETNNHCLFAAPDGDFHTYTLEWTKQIMHIYYDGVTCLKTPWLAKQGGSAPFDQPFILAIGFGTGKFDNAVTDQTPMPVHLDVDYVRVWQ